MSNIIKESIENTIGGNGYAHAKVSQWTNAVVESCLASLTKLQKPFKYIVTCVLMQKNGAGLHTASSCYWDNSTDGSCTVRWENKTMYCIVSVFGLAIWFHEKNILIIAFHIPTNLNKKCKWEKFIFVCQVWAIFVQKKNGNKSRQEKQAKFLKALQSAPFSCAIAIKQHTK